MRVSIVVYGTPVCVAMWPILYFLADDDELTFDPGETITNIEFVSSVLSNYEG